jgi:paraquat-inducible protein B
MLVAMFVLCGALLFTAAIMLFSSGEMFSKKMTFYAFFDTSLNGLDIGAPVKFKGIRVGSVESIEIIYDNVVDEAMTAVIFNINANLFKTIRGNKMHVGDYDMFYAEQIGRGLAAKLSVESILTGKLYVGLDYYRSEQPRFFKNVNLKKYQRMPSVATELDEFMASFDAIMKRLSKFDFETISHKATSLMDELRDKVKDFKFTSMNRAMDAISDVLAFDSSTRQSMDNSLQQLSSALRSLRVFLDFLERNPNALVAGKAK